MATNDNDLIINIQADSKKAVESLEAVRTQLDQMNVSLELAQGHLKRTEESISGFGAAIIVMNEGLELAHKAFEVMSKIFESTVSKFIEADDTLKGLSNTLQLVGEKDVAGATAHFKEFAEGLERTSTVSAETVLQMVTMAKAMGKTDEQAELLAKTSIDFAAGTKQAVIPAFDQLTSTFKGMTRTVQVYDSNIKNLTESQNAQGDAVKLLGKDFAGFGEKMLNTIGGQAKQVEVLMQHTLENVGELFAVFFKLDDKHFAIDSLREINEYIKSLVPTIKAVRESITDEFEHIANAFDAVKDKVGLLKEVLISLGIVMGIVFGQQILAQILAMGTTILGLVKAVYALASAWAASVAAALPVIALYASITAAIIGIGLAIEFAYKNWGKLWDFFKDIASAMLEMVKSLGSAIALAFDPSNWANPHAFDAIGERVSKAIASIKESASKNQIDFGISGKIVSATQQFIQGYNKELVKTKEATDDATASTNRFGAAATGMSKDAQQSFDLLVKSVEQLKLKQTELSGDTNKIAAQRLSLELAQLDALGKQLQARGGLNDAAKKLLQIGIDTAKENAAIEVYEKQKKALDEITSKTKDLQLGVDSYNKTQVDIIDLQLARQMELLELKTQELEKQGLLTDSVKDQIAAQKNLLKKSAEQAKTNAPNPIIESMTNAGKEAGKGITDAFAPMLGITSGVGAYIAAAQAVVDAGPQMLESITHLIDSITELPMKLMEDFNKLFDSIIKFFATLIPNLIKSIEGILKGLVNFVKTLPDVIVKALKEAPKMIMELINELPDIIQQLVEALITMGPKIDMAILEFMLKDSPRIAMKIAEYTAIELPKAIIKGLITAFKEIGGMVSSLFKGKFDFINPKQLEKDVTDVLKKVSASASRIFSVAALTDAANDASKIKADIQADVDKSLSKLKQAWMWVWDHILKPIIDALYKVWQWVWDHVLSPIVDLITKVWQWVWDNILSPIVNLVQKAFQWAWDHVLGPITDLVIKAFKWVWDNILQPFVSILNDSWKILKAVGIFVADLFGDAWKLFKNIFTDLWDTVKKVWNDLMAIFQGKIDVMAGLKKIFADLFDGVVKALRDVFTYFSDVGNSIYKLLKSIFESISSALGTFVNGAGKVGEAIWNAFKDLLSGAGKFFSGIGDGIWNGVKAGFDGSAKFFTGIGDSIWKGLKSGLDGLEKFFKDLFDKINPASLFSKVFSVPSSAWGQGTVEKALSKLTGANVDVPFISFAKGGTVPGHSPVPGNSELNDRILAFVSPGEAIIDREKLANPTIKALVDLIFSGKITAPKFGWGISDVGKAVSSAASSVGSAVSKTVSNVVNLTPEKALEELKKGGAMASDLLKMLDPSQLWQMVNDKLANAVMSIFENNKFAAGGYVGDTVPAMLDPREFVMNPGAVKRIGVNALNAMNSGSHSMGQNITYNIEMPITIKNDGKDIDAAWVRSKVLPTIEDELKKSSLSGRFVMSQKGIRNA